MTTSTMTAIAAPDDIFSNETHPLALSPAEEGRLAFTLGDDLEDNPYTRNANSSCWEEWHAAWMACDLERDNREREDQEYFDWCMTEAAF